MRSGNGGELRRECVRLIRRERKFKQGDCGHRQRCVSGGAVNQHRAGDGNAAPRLDDVCAFDYASSAGNDIFRDEDFFARCDFKIAAKNEFVVFLFRKNEADAELSRDFLSDDQTAHCGSENGFDSEVCEFGQEQFDEAGNFVHVLANLCALEVVGTVKPASQNEMSGEEGAAFFENGENFFLDLRIHSGVKYARSLRVSAN